MRFKLFFRCVCFLIILSPVTSAQEPADQGEGRGVRPGGKTVETFVGTREKPKKPAKSNPSPPLGVGVTIYKQDAKGQWISADPAQTFRSGDRVRFLIEANTGGYLYLFNATNQSAPVMIFPAGDLHGGRNEVKAHVPYEVPSPQTTPPYFEFRGKAGTERMFILFTRQPLTGVLREQALVNYCREKQRQNPNEDCVWGPSTEEWKSIVAKAEAELGGSEKSAIGQAQSPDVRDAASRGVRPPPRAPAPALVRMRNSPVSAKVLLTIDLKHDQ